MADDNKTDDNKVDYKDSLNLPQTEFPMKAGLPKKEVEILKTWDELKLYEKIVEKGKSRPKFTLHDGPPYANGNIHIGHALNKTLKDIIIKSRFMSGFAVSYTPGWDCHGLPIELQVEKKLGKDKNTTSKSDVRKKCRAHAEEFVALQKDQFKRLGILGDWENPYLTMNYKYQAQILRELGKFSEKGLIYKGRKPVHWCSSCQTALAEAEVEHADKESPSVYVKFKVKDTKGVELLGGDNTHIVIWTTTPWTLPANRALAVHPTIDYLVIELKRGGKTEKWVVAEKLLETHIEKFELNESEIKTLGKLTGTELEGVVTTHPFLDRESTVLLADFVTTEAGTGTVHIAPGHGHDDYQLGLKHNLEVYAPVNGYGKFTSDVPLFEGQFVLKANSAIKELMEENGTLVKEEKINHSYPHCWRCKKAVIFRATEQWFVPMDAKANSDKTLRENALTEIDKVGWHPSWGRDRIYSMIEGRPDWCLSRQRVWGVPIPALKCKSCENTFIDNKFVEKLANEFETDSADIWFDKELSELLPTGVECPECSGKDFEKEQDILDVWFDSGVSFASVLENNDDCNFPADLYLEGSDQHRGWFHSSLLTATATRGHAPYKSVLTHGFVVDGKGKKMSKSVGNVIAPSSITDKSGADILRLWVASEDYRDDIRISNEILTRLSETYRRIRNTFRYMLGNLQDFNPDTDMVDYKDLSELDKYALHRLNMLNEKVRTAYDKFEFHSIYHNVQNFCTLDLSAFYLDAIKDKLYTSKENSSSRRGAQTVMYHVLDHLVRLLAPILVFTTHEVWQHMPHKKDDNGETVHLEDFPTASPDWLNEAIKEQWTKISNIKETASVVLERARQDKVIGHSLNACIIISNEGNGKDFDFAKEIARDLKEVLIISQIKFEESPMDINLPYVISLDEFPGIKLRAVKADGEKCERCWNYSIYVGENKEHPTVCEKCVEALT